MSEHVNNGTGSNDGARTPECDRALDYLYEMLDGEDKARYLVHLGTCPRCQQELEGFGRVREVAQAVLPKVEPTERLTGALHAQLMHEAAQRAHKAQEPTGKILPFVRRVMRHPGYAAAAGILLIGGAVGVQFSRGNLRMMEPPVTASAPAPAASAKEVAAPVAEPDEAKVADTKVADKRAEEKPAEHSIEKSAAPMAVPVVAAAPAADAPTALAQGDTERAKLKKEAPGAGLEDLLAQPDPAKPAPRPTRRSRGGDSLDSLADSGEGALSSSGVKGASGAGQAEISKDLPSRGPATPAPKAAYAPAPPPPQAVAPAAPAPSMGSSSAYKPDNRVDTKAPAPEAAYLRQEENRVATREKAEKPEAARRDEDRRVEREQQAPAGGIAGGGAGKNGLNVDDEALARSSSQNAAPRAAAGGRASAGDVDGYNKAPSRKADGIDAERERATTLAQAGRCDEAASIYQALDHKAPDRLSQQDRLSYVRCLRALGRLEPAQSELDQLRANKQAPAVPAGALQAEQRAIDTEQKRRAANMPESTGQRRSATKAKKAVRSNDSYEAPSAPADANIKRAF